MDQLKACLKFIYNLGDMAFSQNAYIQTFLKSKQHWHS